MSHILDTPLTSRLIFLDSDDRVDKTTNASTCTFALTNPIILSTEDVHILLSLESASIPLTMNTINSRMNVWSVTIDSTTYSYTIPSGNYTITQLTTYINALSAFTSNNITMSYSTITNSVTFTASLTTTQIQVNAPTYNLNQVLGFYEFETSSSISGVLVAPCGVDLSGTRSVYFDLTNIQLENQDSQSNGGYGTILQRIPINQKKGTILNYVGSSFAATIAERNITSFNIVLRDDSRTAIDFDRNTYWAATLRVDFVTQKKTPIQVTLKDILSPSLDGTVMAPDINMNQITEVPKLPKYESEAEPKPTNDQKAEKDDYYKMYPKSDAA